jgi:transcriptional regulator with XRE-family HTH domain
MSIQVQVDLRTRKLGVLIRDSRLAARKSIPECAAALGVTRGIFRAYEEGRRAPSLPEMEILTYFLHLPIRHYWSREVVSDDAPPTASLDLPALLAVRQRMIGALLRQEREKASISIKVLAGQTGISASRIRAYELGERPIPVPMLEGLISTMGGQIEGFFDQAGPIGKWISQQKAIEEFIQLPPTSRISFAALSTCRIYNWL